MKVNQELNNIRFRLSKLLVSSLFDISMESIEQLASIYQFKTQEDIWKYIEDIYHVEYFLTRTAGAFRHGRGTRFGFRFFPYRETGDGLSFAAIESFEVNRNNEYAVLNKNGIKTLNDLEEICDYVHSRYLIVQKNEIII